MALTKSIVLVKTSKNAEGELELSAQFYDELNKERKLNTRGAIDFYIENRGSAKIFLFDNREVVVLPGERWMLNKSISDPYKNDIQYSFENDYRVTRSNNNLSIPDPQTNSTN